MPRAKKYSEPSVPSRFLPASRLLPLLGLATAVGLYCGVDTHESPAPDVPSAAAPGPARPPIPASLRLAILHKAQQDAGPAHALSPDPLYGQQRLLARSPEAGILAHLDAQGIYISSLVHPSSSPMRLALTAYGCADAPQKVQALVPPTQDGGNRAQYQRPSLPGGLTEWYVNSPLGLEQGFTIERDPGCTAGGKLSFELSLPTQAAVALVGQGAAAHLELRDGSRVLRYGDLFALDAAGRELPARMVLAGKSVRLEVEAQGAQYPVVVDPTFIEQQKLTASDGAASDGFGYAVALSADGNTAIVGAYQAAHSGLANAGAVYVYTRTGGVFGAAQKLVSSDLAASDSFGRSVALSADGNTAIVGATGADPGGTLQAGAAYVYTRSGGTFGSEQKLFASDKVSTDNYGYSVALSADGNTAIVGSYHAAPGGLSTAGAAYVYTRTAGTFGGEQKLTASDKAAQDQFGISVALSADGSVAIVGAYTADPAGLANAGAAYVYTRTAGTFGSEQKLTASDQASGNNFGRAVALSADGNTAIVTAFNASVGGKSLSGAAYVYTRSAGTFGGEQKLSASDKASSDSFGISVALSADGNTAIVGAHNADVGGSSNSGAAYVYTRTAGTFGGEQKLTASDKAAGDAFGFSVALSGDGSTALIAAILADPAGLSNAGAVYAFVPFTPQVDGTPCAGNAQCASGNCTDGVCCDLPCAGGTSDCLSCLGAQTGQGDGKCARIQAAANFTCRPQASGKACDVAEVCDGTSDSCPSDGFKAPGVECRAANGVCDQAETCPGGSPDCPADGFKLSSAVCRPANGVCDAAENCTGTTTACPADAFKTSGVCRSAAGACDVAESCDGSGTACPPDIKKSAGTQCRAPGTSLICDPADVCDGTRTSCPAKYASSGTTCENGGTCNGLGSCR